MNRRVREVATRLPLLIVVLVAGYLAVRLHRNGHSTGDDFALYLRQARSVFDGDMDQVIADNRFAVLNSPGAFSPIVYPWGFPILLSPFVRFIGLDFDKLKMVDTVCFCVWLVMMHGIVRRRLGRWLALGITAALGTAPIYLQHTNEILSEFPYLVTVTIVIWYVDRVHRHRRLDSAATTSHAVQLAMIGVLVAVSFNFRRDALGLLVAVAAVQVVDVLTTRHRRQGEPRPASERFGFALALPYLGFAGAAVFLQLLLPSALFPDSGDAPRYIVQRFFKDYPSVLSQQLGLGGDNHLYGVLILLVAALGVVIGIARRPAPNALLAGAALGPGVMMSTHFRMVDRYYFQVTPIVLYFVTVALVGVVTALVGAARRTPPGLPRRLLPAAAVAVGLVPSLWLTGAHLADTPRRIGLADEFNDAGRILFGPALPASEELFAAVEKYTDTDEVVAFFRARTMTLMTDRRSFQTTSAERIGQRADYFAQRKGSDYSQPTVLAVQGLGWEKVWENSTFILWRIDRTRDK